MSTLTIHDFPDALMEAFEAVANKHGITVEAYARQLLLEVYFEDSEKKLTMADVARKYFGPENGINLDLPSRHSSRELPEFDD